MNTSKAANAKIKRQTGQMKIFQYIKSRKTGATHDEIMKALDGVVYYSSVRRRITELLESNWIEYNGQVRKGVSYRFQKVLVVKP